MGAGRVPAGLCIVLGIASCEPGISNGGLCGFTERYSGGGLLSNDASAQDDLPPIAAAPTAAPAPDAATVTPLRVLLLVAGILIVPGILLRMIFKFGATTRRRLYADRAGRKRNDGVVSRWAATTFGASAERPRGPTMPASPSADAEQLLRKIIWELERSAVMPMPGPLNRA